MRITNQQRMAQFLDHAIANLAELKAIAGSDEEYKRLNSMELNLRAAWGFLDEVVGKFPEYS